MASLLTIQNARLVGGKVLEQAIVKAFKQWAETDIDEDHWDAQFRDMDRWDWPNETKRRSGAIVDSPRDIYDLGDLYRSKKFSLTTQGDRAEASWYWDATNSSGVEYAWYVHEGTRFMDGRPFTDDISIASSFWRKEPGKALKLQVETELARLNGR
jgi:hypothetical protein